MNRYLRALLRRYVELYSRPGDRVVTLAVGRSVPADAALPAADPAELRAANYVVLDGILHYSRDIQRLLSDLRAGVSDHARLVVVYYSALWRPIIRLAGALGWRSKMPELNWLAHSDIENLLLLTDFEPLHLESKILLPVRIPVISDLVNRYLAPIPGFSSLCLANVLLARPVPASVARTPSVSVVVPARNESGNIDAIVGRLPRMGPDDELIFVEGGSRDDTWARIQAAVERGRPGLRIVATQQEGRGKGDAVRKGFALARNEILMILDADLTVPPEDLPKFYEAIVRGKGEFINGSRLVYPMERGAMRFFNLLGNKFFALAFSYVLGQRFKDTLCGTKVLSRGNYETLARHRGYFGNFDPFGDFDLIFGAARMGLKIVEIPIVYRERVYGETNISRWRHGAILFAMLGFAARRLKFI